MSKNYHNRVIQLLVINVLLIGTICTERMQSETELAHLAGSWYPANAATLTNALQSYNTQAATQFGMRADGTAIRALIVPHAGYQYSGIIATAAYRLLKPNNIDRIIILAPSHFVAFNAIALPAFSEYKIPTGSVPIDTAMIQKLQRHPLFTINTAAFNPEHSLEIQLPLIQYYVPHVKIIPLIVGQLTTQDADTVAQALQPFVTSRTLVIVSSDLTHFGTAFNYIPFKDNILLNTRQLDSAILNTIQQNNLQGFRQLIQQTGDTVCGRIPIEILLKMINLGTFGKTITRLVAYGTSADTTGDITRLVTYGSLIVTQETNNTILNMQEKNALLQYARNILTQAFNPTVDTTLLKPIMTAALQQPTGAFVTLYTKNGTQKMLRGCIGNIVTPQPLYQTVANMTLASAFQDPRFTPVKLDELNNIQINISVLTAPYSVASYNDIVLNKNGIILTAGKNAAVFLPKVPQEFGWNKEQTLTELSKKAGLTADAWRSQETKFQVFESIDFGEQ